MNLCLFDLDHTLLPLDSDHAFGEFLIQQNLVDGPSYRARNNAFYQQYQVGGLDLNAYVDFATAGWRHLPVPQREMLQRRFVDEIIRPALRVEAQQLVSTHQQAGDLVAIVTATNEFVTRPIASLFGVSHLLAVELARDEGGNITGRIRGVPSFQAGKVARVHDWLTGLGMAWQQFPRTFFYSDSPNDLPLLRLVSDPVATNPSPALEQIAQSQGWPVLKLFE